MLLLSKVTYLSGVTRDSFITRNSDEIHSHDTYTQRVVDKAQKQALIERVKGKPPGPGQFAPIFNVITDKGRRLLQEQLLNQLAPKLIEIA